MQSLGLKVTRNERHLRRPRFQPSNLNILPLSPDYLPQFSLGTAALVIFAVCAGFVLLRGMTRMVVGTAILGLSTWIGFRVWQQAPSLSIDWTGKSLPWITTGAPLTAFLMAFFILRKIVKTMAKPFGKSSEATKPRSLAMKVVMLLFALIPTSLIWLVGIALVHHQGSVAELRSYSQTSRGISETQTDSLSERLKSTIESVLPTAWITALDPLTQPSRIALAKLITARSESTPKPVIDPRTGKPIPRAIIVDDLELQTLAREGNFGTLLRHPLLTKALSDPKIQKLLRDHHL